MLRPRARCRGWRADPPSAPATGCPRAQRVRRQRPHARVGDEAPALQDRPVPVRRRLPRVHVAARRARPSRRVRRHRRHARCRARRARRRARAARSAHARRAPASRAAASTAWRGSSSAGRTRRRPWRASRALWNGGYATTVDLLGEKTLTLADADAYARACPRRCSTRSRRAAPPGRRSRRSNATRGARCRASTSRSRPSALAPLLAPATADEGIAEALERLAPILDTARAADATIHLDTEHDELKDATFQLLREIGARYPEGPAARLRRPGVPRRRRSTTSAISSSGPRDTLARPLQIRLVKGAYWDVETIKAHAQGWKSPVWPDKDATDASYEGVRVDARRRTPGDVRPAFASHNARSIACGVVRGARRGPARRRGRGAGAARHGRTAARRRARPRRPHARVRAGRRPRARHGVSRAPPAREHVERVVRAPPLRRGLGARRARRATAPAGRAASPRPPARSGVRRPTPTSPAGSSTSRPRELRRDDVQTRLVAAVDRVENASSTSRCRSSSTASRSTPATDRVRRSGPTRRDRVPQRVGDASPRRPPRSRPPCAAAPDVARRRHGATAPRVLFRAADIMRAPPRRARGAVRARGRQAARRSRRRRVRGDRLLRVLRPRSAAMLGDGAPMLAAARRGELATATSRAASAS